MAALHGLAEEPIVGYDGQDGEAISSFGRRAFVADWLCMADVVGVLLVSLGLWLIIDRIQFASDNARWHRVKWPIDSSDPRVQRLNSFGFALFGVLFVLAGAYVIALAAKVAP